MRYAIMNLFSLFQFSLPYGLLLCLFLGLITKGTLYWNAEIWISDYPPDVQADYGAMNVKTKKQKGVVSIFFLLALFTPLVLAVVRLNELLAGGVIFWPVFWVTFFALQIFNVFDLLVLDWLIFVTWQPHFLILPGTEGMAGYKKYAFHAKGFLAGTLLWLILALIVAGMSAVVL